MSNSRYILLTEVAVLHSYFDNGIFADLKVLPDQRTQTFMWNAGLLFRATAKGFSVSCPESFDAAYIRELTGFFGPYHLRFQLFATSEDYVNYTETPLDTLVAYQFDNRKLQPDSIDMIPLGKLGLAARTALGHVDLYLDQFISGEEIMPREYSISFTARSTRWHYYLMNISAREVSEMVIQDEDGYYFEGPTETRINEKMAYLFTSGTHLYPLKERSQFTISLKMKQTQMVGDQSQSDVEEFVQEKLPLANARLLNEIEKLDTDEHAVACSAIYVYL